MVNRAAKSLRRLSFEPLEDRRLLATILENFDDAAALQLNGSAHVADGQLWLTTGTAQRGTAWFDELISPDHFVAKFDFDMRNRAGFGWGDGMTFAVIDAGTHGPGAVGDSGGGLGYYWLSGFAIEIDTYRNDDIADPAYVHVGLDARGEVRSLATAALPFTVLDAGPFSMEITFDQGLVTVSVQAPGQSPVQVLSGQVPPDAIPAVGRFGFTGGTGAAGQTTSIDNFSISFSAGDVAVRVRCLERCQNHLVRLPSHGGRGPVRDRPLSLRRSDLWSRQRQGRHRRARETQCVGSSHRRAGFGHAGGVRCVEALPSRGCGSERRHLGGR